MSSDLRVDWCDHEAAKYAVEHWHYSHCLPLPPHNRLGVWEAGKFRGAVIFSRGAANGLGAPYGLGIAEVCELTRVALARHQAPVSRIVRIALLFLRRQSPGLRLVVSFADPSQGHYGGVYQAGGWIYTGTTKSDFALIDREGKRWHSRSVAESGVKTQFGRPKRVLRPSEGTRIELPGKHRYLMPLDDEMRARLLPLARPYPKRAKQATVADLAAGGGAAPTRTLQL